MQDAAEIQRILDSINQGWVSGSTEGLERYFDPGVVFRGPNFEEVARGREACVASYRDFAREAQIGDATISPADIDVFGETAVAAYAWKLSYELGGRQYEESGREAFVFRRTAAGWVAVWRAMVFEKT